MANKRINYTIGFNVDKQGLNTMKAELREIQSLSTKDLFKTSGINVLQGDLEKAQNAAKHLEGALEKAFNPALGTLNIQKFNEELNKGDWNAQKVKDELSKIGTTGSAAFRNVTMELMTQNKYLKQSSEFLDKMATTMANTVRWSITSSIMNSITSSIQQAYGYAKNLDTSLNDIRIVTGKSADEMSRFAVEANKAAKSLGQSTKSYTDASLIYYQQGLSDKEVKARAETTLKAANVTGQSARTVSEQLTAVWNGYKVSAQEAELYVDKLAAVAATTAADLEELSTGMSKVASAANIMGVDIDQLNAQLATIVSVTREAPESIGTALKTVYARMSDIEAGLDTETTLGEYTQQMEAMGIHALDANKQLRDQGEVIEEIGNKWHTLSREQQVSLAQTIAGTRQYSRMMALFDNWDMYTQAMKTSADAAGTLQRQQDIYMESTEAHLQKLSTQMEELYTTLFDTEDINDLVDGLTEIVNGLDAVIKGLGGGAGMLRNFGAIGVNVFSGQIAKGISRVITNQKAQSEEMQNQIALMEAMDKFGVKANPEEQTDADKKILAQTRKWKENENLMSDEEREASRALLERYNTELKISEALEKEKKQYNEILKVFTEYEDGIVTSTNGTIKILGDENASLEDVSASLKIQVDEWSAIEKNAADALKQIEKVKNAQRDEKAAGQSIGGLKSQISQAETKRENILQGQNLKFYKKQEQVLLKRQNEDGTFNNAEDAKSLEDIQKIILKVEELDRKLQTYKQNITDITEEAAKPVEKEFSKLEETVKHVFQDFADKEETIQRSFVPNKDQQKDYDRFIQLYGELSKHAKKANNELKVTDDNINDVSEMLKLFNKLFGDSSKKIQEAAKSFEDLDERSQRSSRNLEAYGNTFDKILEKIDLTKTVEQFVNLGGSILNLGNAVEQFKSLGSIWENEDMTAGEKFIATVSAMTFGLTSGIQAVKGFQEAKKWLTDALNINTVASEINSEAVNKNKKEHQEAAAAVDKHNDEIKENTADKVVNTAVDGVDGKKPNAWKQFSTNFKSGAKTTGKVISGIGTKIGAVITNPYVLAAAGVAATVAATWAIADNAYNKAEKQAKKAAKAAKELASAYQEAKNKLDEMSSSLDAYTEAQQKLSELTRGTEGYNKALQESNDLVMDLITKYPELAKGIKTVDGALVLDENIKNAMLAAERDKTSTARIASLNASAAVTQVKTNAALEQSSKIFNVNEGWAVVKGLLLTSTAVGMIAAITEAIVAGGVNEVFEDRMSTDSLSKAVEAFNAGVALSNESELLKYGLTRDEIKALQENESALVQLAQEMKTNNELLRAQRLASATERTKAAGYIGNNKDILDYIFTDDEYQGKIDAEALAEARAMSNKQLKEFAENFYGGQVSSIGGSTFKVRRLNEDGSLGEAEEFTKDALYQAIAAERSKDDDKYAVAEISAKIETALNTFSQGSERNSYKLGQQLLAFARKGLAISDLPMKDLEAFQKALVEGQLPMFTEVFADMGVTESELEEWFKAQEAQATARIKELETELKTKGIISLDSTNPMFADFSMSEVAEVLSMLNDTMESFGEDNQVDDLIEMLKGKGAKGSKFLQEFIKLDFAADNIETQIAELAKLFNIDLNPSAIAIWTDQIQVTQGIFEAMDPDKIREFNRAMSELSFGIQTGKGITDEEYELYYASDENWADKFTDSVGGYRYFKGSNKEWNEWLYGQDFFNKKIQGNFDQAAKELSQYNNKVNAEDQRKTLAKSWFDVIPSIINSTNLHTIQTTIQSLVANNIIKEAQGITWNTLFDRSQLVASSFDNTAITKLIEGQLAPDDYGGGRWDYKTFGQAGIDKAFIQQLLQTYALTGLSGVRVQNAIHTKLDDKDSTGWQSLIVADTEANSKYVNLRMADLNEMFANMDSNTKITYQMAQAISTMIANISNSSLTSIYALTEEQKSAITSIGAILATKGTIDPDQVKSSYTSALDEALKTARSEQEIDWAKTYYQEQTKDLLDIFKLTNDELNERISNAKDNINEAISAIDQYSQANVNVLETYDYFINKINKDLATQQQELEKQDLVGKELIDNLQTQVSLNNQLLQQERQKKQRAKDEIVRMTNEAKNTNYIKDLFDDEGNLKYNTIDEVLAALSLSTKIVGFNENAAEKEKWTNFFNNYFNYLNQIPEIEASIAEREDFAMNLYTEQYLAQLDRINSELETQLNYYQKINDYQRSLIDLAEISGESLAALSQRQNIMTNNAITMAIKAMEALKAADWNTLLSDGFEDAADLQAFEQSFNTAFEAVLTAIESVNEKFQNAVRTAFGIENQDFQVYEAEWTKLRRQADAYYDSVNKAYKISEVKDKYIEAINNASSLEIERQITEEMNRQIAQLQSIEKLRESDLKIAEARLEVLKAEIALEEARESKTTMQLRLGVNGAYSYQYVADQEAIRKAEAELEKAKNEEYNLIKDNYMDSVDEVRDIRAEWQEAAAAEKSQEELNEINELYSDLYDEALRRNQETWNAYNKYSQENGFDLPEESRWQTYLNETAPTGATIVESINEAFGDMTTDISTLEGHLNSLVGENGYMSLLSNSLKSLQNPVEEIAQSLKSLTWDGIVDAFANVDTISKLDSVSESLEQQFPEFADVINNIKEQRLQSLTLLRQFREGELGFVNDDITTASGQLLDKDAFMSRVTTGLTGLTRQQANLLYDALQGNFNPIVPNLGTSFPFNTSNNYNDSTVDNSTTYNTFNFYDVNTEEITELIGQNMTSDNAI